MITITSLNGFRDKLRLWLPNFNEVIDLTSEELQNPYENSFSFGGKTVSLMIFRGQNYTELINQFNYFIFPSKD